MFFDVDFTIVDPGGFRPPVPGGRPINGVLRPGVLPLFQQLTADGHTLSLWSGMGIRWDVVSQFGLKPYVNNCYRKPIPDELKPLNRMLPIYAKEMHQLELAAPPGLGD